MIFLEYGLKVGVAEIVETNSLEIAEHIIDNVAEKGGQIFYDKYIN